MFKNIKKIISKIWQKPVPQGYCAFYKLLVMQSKATRFPNASHNKKMESFLCQDIWDQKTSTMFLMGILFDSGKTLPREDVLRIIKNLHFDVTLPLHKITSEMYTVSSGISEHWRIKKHRKNNLEPQSSYVYSVWDHLALSHDEDILLAIAESIHKNGLPAPFSSSICYRYDPVSEEAAYIILKKLRLLPLDMDKDIPCLHLSPPVHALKDVLSHCVGADRWRGALVRCRAETLRDTLTEHVACEASGICPKKARKI